jgi:hypothetical protein
MSIARIGKWILYILIASVAMHFLVSYIFPNDPSRSNAEAFLETHPRIQSMTGEVQSIKLFKLQSIQAAERMPAYKLYFFDVKGTKGAAEVVIRAESLPKSSEISFSIDLISAK